MLKLAVLVSGGGTNLQAIINHIEKGFLKNTCIEIVISNNKKAFALERAKNHGIKAKAISPKDYETREIFNNELLMAINAAKVDLVVLAGCLLTIPAILIQNYPGKIINIHPSLIPSFCGIGYYGLRVHKAVLERGVKVTGATVHFVDEGMDTGPIILQKPVEVLENDTAEELQKRVMEEAEWIILPKAIELIADDKIELKDNKVYIRRMD